VVQLTDDSGDAVWYYDYDAFGNERAITGQDASLDANPFRYCGEYFDKETGTIYLRARYYDPVIGRFTQMDPVQDGLSWYLYCGNNPILFIDPSGTYYIVMSNSGYYSIVGFSATDAVVSTGISAIPVVGGPSADKYIPNRVKKLGTVVGGTSYNPDSSITSIGVGLEVFIWLWDQAIFKGIPLSATGQSLYNGVSYSDMIDYDKTVLALMDIYGLVNSYSSLDLLTERLGKLDAIIADNPDYFRYIYPSYLTYGYTNYGGYNNSQFLRDYSIIKLPESERLTAIARNAGVSTNSDTAKRLLEEFNTRIDFYYQFGDVFRER